MVARVKTFSMPLMPHVDTVLVFDADQVEETGMYTIYSIEPDDNERFRRGEWDAMRRSLTPTVRLPITDVAFDEATGFHVHTHGIESFSSV